MEQAEEGALDDIWAELEGFVADRDWESAEEVIDTAEGHGWLVTQMQDYLAAEKLKAK